MFQNNLLMAAASAGLPDAIVTYTTTANSTVNQSVYTFSSQDISTAAANRTVIVGVVCHADALGAITSVTIGGNTATEVVYSQGPAAASEECGIYTYALTTGTTADIVVTISGSPHRCQIGVWAAYGIGDSDDTVTDIVLPFSQSITLSEGGVAVAVSMNNVPGGNVTSWGSDFTERYDVFVEPNTAASGADSTGGGSKTVSVTWSSGGEAMIAAAWPKGEENINGNI